MFKRVFAICAVSLGLVGLIAPVAAAGKPTGPTVKVTCTYQAVGTDAYQYNVYVSTSGGVSDVTVSGTNSTGGTTNIGTTRTQGNWVVGNTGNWYFTAIHTVYTNWHKQYSAAWSGTQTCTEISG